MMYSNNKKAAQGVGTLIIFIALILVAAVAAAVLIGTASNLQSSAFNVGSETEERLLTALDVVQVTAGDTSDGFINGTDNGGTDEYLIRMRLASGSIPIKQEDLIVGVDTANTSQVLTYSDSTADDTTFNLTTLSGSDEIPGYIESGELVEVRFQAQADVTERESVEITVLTANGGLLPVKFTTPSVMITQTTKLYP